MGYTTTGRETLRTNIRWHILSAISPLGSAGKRTAMSPCNHEVHRRRHQKCVLCACQFHLHQGSEKAISFPDSLNTLKKTSVQNDQSRLAQLSATSRRRKNNMSDRKPPAVFVVRVHFHQFRESENDGQDLLRPVCEDHIVFFSSMNRVSQSSHRKRTSLTSASSAKSAPFKSARQRAGPFRQRMRVVFTSFMFCWFQQKIWILRACICRGIFGSD